MTNESLFFDRRGEPITVERWAALFEDQGYSVLACTQVGEHLVITKWLGTNDEMTDPPAIFGTIVKTGEEFHNERRTCTEEEALAMHAQVCSGPGRVNVRS